MNSHTRFMEKGFTKPYPSMNGNAQQQKKLNEL
jgi:hypothetical protein